MNSEIILIGPIGAEKGSVGKLLSEKLNIPQVEVDELRSNLHFGLAQTNRYLSAG